MKRTIYFCFLVILAVTATSVSIVAQAVETDTGVQIEKDLALLRRDLRSEKKKLIAMNVPLTDVEATKFWPVYDAYAADMTKHYDQFYGIIKEYAANQKTLTDEHAIDMIKRWSAVQVQLAQTAPAVAGWPGRSPVRHPLHIATTIGRAATGDTIAA